MNPEPVPDPPPPIEAPAELPAEVDPPAEPPPLPPEEVVVWGRLAVDQARDALVREIESLGFREARRRDDRVVLRSGDWRGRVLVGPEGELTFRHPIASPGPVDSALYTTDPTRTSPDFHTAGPSVGAGATAALPGPRVNRGVEAQIFDATADERSKLRAILERTRQEEWLEALPERLEDLWSDGAALRSGEEPVPETDRRAAVLAYWASLPADPFGDRCTEVVERWMAERLQEPLSADERARFEAGRADDRLLPAARSPSP